MPEAWRHGDEESSRAAQDATEREVEREGVVDDGIDELRLSNALLIVRAALGSDP